MINNCYLFIFIRIFNYMKKKISLKLVREFLLNLGFDWKFFYLKNNLESFVMAKKFDEIFCLSDEEVFLELFQNNKIYYFWFVITEEKFQKVVYKKNLMSGALVEDYSDAWRSFISEELTI